MTQKPGMNLMQECLETRLPDTSSRIAQIWKFIWTVYLGASLIFVKGIGSKAFGYDLEESEWKLD